MARRGFFDLGKAVDDIRDAQGFADTSLASMSLLGKGMFNVARFAVTEGIDRFAHTTANQIIKNPSSTEEQKIEARENISRAEQRMAMRKEADQAWELEKIIRSEMSS